MSFARFMATPLGRGLRVAAGIGLIVAGWLTGGSTGWVLALVGLAPLLAGALNVCVIAPLIGAPLLGRRALSDR